MRGCEIKISIIIPVLNEAETIESTLAALQMTRAQGAEIIVVDGGSSDSTVTIAKQLSDRVMTAPAGRALQMNAGARVATGNVLFFLHADSLPPSNADHRIKETLASSGRDWGRFNVRISGASSIFPLIAWMMNWRSRLTGIATGDQGIFVTRDAFDAIGGFPEIPLMEDIALSRLLKRRSRPICLREKIVTSGRRWESNGVIRTMLLMWGLRTAYFLGTDPARLAVQYTLKKR